MNQGMDDLSSQEEYTIICMILNGLDTSRLSKAAKKAIARDFISHFWMDFSHVDVKNDDKKLKSCLVNGLYYRKDKSGSYALKPDKVATPGFYGDNPPYGYSVVSHDSNKGISTISDYTDMGTELRRLEKRRNGLLISKRDEDDVRIHTRFKRAGKKDVEFTNFVDPRVDNGNTLKLGPRYNEERILEVMDWISRGDNLDDESPEAYKAFLYKRLLAVFQIAITRSSIRIGDRRVVGMHEITKRKIGKDGDGEIRKKFTEKDEQWQV